MDYNEVLLIIGLGAIYLFEFYALIAVLNTNHDEYLLLSVKITSIIECSLQSIMIIDCLKMFTEDKELKKLKPGRSLITALILVDVSLWLSETFSVKKYDMYKVEIGYYNTIFWSIVSIESE